LSHPGARSARHSYRNPAGAFGLLPFIRWQYSLILPIALLLLIATLVLSDPRKDLLHVNVASSMSGEAVAGAVVTIGGLSYLADTRGAIVVERPDGETDISAHADGFRSASAPVVTADDGRLTIQLQPSVVNGVIQDATTGDPLRDVDIALLDVSGEPVAETRSDDQGAYIFKNLPDDASLRVMAGSFGTHIEEVDERSQVNFLLQMSVAHGTILDDQGQPVHGAVVQSEEVKAVTGSDGLFTLEGVTQGATVTVTAPGFERATTTVTGDRLGEIAMQPQLVKAVYASLGLLADPDGLDSLIEIANTTEINAIVIDIKQDTIYYDSQVQFFRDAGTVAPIYDAHEVLQRLEDNNIYAIARLVVFQDPLVAEAYPHLAVHDTSGDLWRNEMGVAWVSAFHEELWDANIELALEALDLGFDEIQYDYVRFPSDGDLSTADFGREYTGEARQAAITGFMKRSYEAIHARGGLLAADLFGFITIVDDEQYIGQRFSELEPYLDYVCMMIYPSHFTEGNIASAPGHPNDYPYETIYESLQRAEQIAPHATKKFRPWLQDFTYWNMREYTASDVRAQIDAAEDFGASGWMLWGDSFNVTVDALRPDEGGE